MSQLASRWLELPNVSGHNTQYCHLLSSFTFCYYPFSVPYSTKILLLFLVPFVLLVFFHPIPRSLPLSLSLLLSIVFLYFFAPYFVFLPFLLLLMSARSSPFPLQLVFLFVILFTTLYLFSHYSPFPSPLSSTCTFLSMT
jgi:hypothetical protein